MTDSDLAGARLEHEGRNEEGELGEENAFLTVMKSFDIPLEKGTFSDDPKGRCQNSKIVTVSISCITVQ